MLIYLNRKGQSTLEYAVVIAIIVTALLAMQAYIKRGLQGRLRQASDDIGGQFSAQQTTASFATTTSANTTERVTPVVSPSGDNVTQTRTTSRQRQSRSVNESVSALDQEYWPQ